MYIIVEYVLTYPTFLTNPNILRTSKSHHKGEPGGGAAGALVADVDLIPGQELNDAGGSK